MCSIPADHHHVAELAADCERVLLKLGWPDEPATAARLLVMEHGANTVDHGQVPPSSLIFFQLRVTGNTAGLLFRDNGREWDLDDGLASATQRGPDAPRGRGLNIIRAIANHIEVFRRGSENIAFYLLSADFNAAKK
ncbi:MAG: ATP-binding protein [Kiritimatiellaeota bacterium]|nr:ATP-binding protein [Kiritimatiellota bacterium]